MRLPSDDTDGEDHESLPKLGSFTNSVPENEKSNRQSETIQVRRSSMKVSNKKGTLKKTDSLPIV